MSSRDVGSVETEARLLAEALARVHRHDDDPVWSEPGGDRPHLHLVEDDEDDENAADAAGAECPAEHRGRDRSGAASRCETCGAGPVEQGQDERGRGGCPVCHGAAWARAHAPEALRSLADAAGLLADGLRTLASTIEESPRNTASADADSVSGDTFQDREGRERDGDRRPTADLDEREERA